MEATAALGRLVFGGIRPNRYKRRHTLSEQDLSWHSPRACLKRLRRKSSGWVVRMTIKTGLFSTGQLGTWSTGEAREEPLEAEDWRIRLRQLARERSRHLAVVGMRGLVTFLDDNLVKNSSLRSLTLWCVARS
jgi:hypothetical protein